jgi:hypothetical protein
MCKGKEDLGGGHGVPKSCVGVMDRQSQHRRGIFQGDVCSSRGWAVEALSHKLGGVDHRLSEGRRAPFEGFGKECRVQPGRVGYEVSSCNNGLDISSKVLERRLVLQVAVAQCVNFNGIWLDGPQGLD